MSLKQPGRYLALPDVALCREEPGKEGKGASNFTMTIYGAPSTPADLKALIQFMKNEGLGQGLDPGPPATKQNLAILAESNFTFTSFYAAGDFEVPSGGGPYQWSNETLDGLLGAGLEGLCAQAAFLPSNMTYEERSVESNRLPGALVKGMRFTL